jgi:hypothetical protein
LHISAVTDPRAAKVIPKNSKEHPDLLPSTKMKNQNSTFKTSNTRQTLTRHSQARVQYGTQNAMDTNQQDTKITTTQNQYGKPTFFETHFASS